MLGRGVDVLVGKGDEPAQARDVQDRPFPLRQEIFEKKSRGLHDRETVDLDELAIGGEGPVESLSIEAEAGVVDQGVDGSGGRRLVEKDFRPAGRAEIDRDGINPGGAGGFDVRFEGRQPVGPAVGRDQAGFFNDRQPPGQGAAEPRGGPGDDDELIGER